MKRFTMFFSLTVLVLTVLCSSAHALLPVEEAYVLGKRRTADQRTVGGIQRGLGRLREVAGERDNRAIAGGGINCLKYQSMR